MALIGSIRKRSGILITLVALAVGGFVVMDMTSGGGGNRGGLFDSGNTLGKVNGKKISYSEFSELEKNMARQGDVFGSRQQVWDYLVDNTIVEDEAKCLGMAVTEAELIELEFGAPQGLSPIITNRFADRQTGGVNLEMLNQYKQAIVEGKLNPEQRQFWAQQQKEIIAERLRSKLTTMVSKAVYVPTWQAEQMYKEQNEKSDVLLVKVPFAKIPDAEVSVTDADFSAYIAENKGRFFREKEGRKINYVSFNVAASSADSAAYRTKLAGLVSGFRATKNDSSFTLLNNGNFDGRYSKRSQLSKPVQDSLFGGSIGKVIGPYADNGAYVLAKLVSRMSMPDSVRASHILVAGAGAQKTIDSLKVLIESGKARFDSVAIRFSTDPGSGAKGGDLGLFGPGMMVKPFNDVCFLKGEIGKLYTVTTQFGVHLIKVTEKKKSSEYAQIAYVGEPIVPSRETSAAAKDKANQFLASNRSIEALKETTKNDQSAGGLQLSNYVDDNAYDIGAQMPGETSREIVRAAYKAKVGEVFPQVFEFRNEGEYHTSRYIVAGLRSIVPAGLPSVADIKEDIEADVKNVKKGDVIKNKIAGSKDLNAIATMYGMKVDTVKQIAFGAPFIQNVGNEAKLTASIFKQQQGGTTDAIVGRNGVYVANVINRSTATPPADLTSIQKQFATETRNVVRGRLISAMKKKAKIQDSRANFF
jgi:peptidyl-prolyl cis-trans isomerase D